MSRQSNKLTLNKKNDRLNSLSLNPSQFFKIDHAINTFKRALFKKNIWITYNNYNITPNTCYLSLDIFLGSKNLLKLKKNTHYIKKTIFKAKKKEKDILKKFTQTLHKIFKNKLIIIKSVLLNKRIKVRPLIKMYSKLKEFIRPLFGRRTNFFLDFLKLTNLFMRKKINVSAFLDVIVIVFKILPKKLHGKCFALFRKVLSILVTRKYSKIKGIKLTISGRLKGKLRSDSLSFSYGNLKTQSSTSDTDFSKKHVHTLYGCYGLKMWVNYRKKDTK